MAVVVNEFEVVPGETPRPQQGAAGQHEAAPPDPARALEELERATRHLKAREARLHAT
jgi:hypothetical protein